MPDPTPTQTELRKADALNRSKRVLLNGLIFTVLYAVVTVLLPIFTSATGWADFHWSQIAFSIVQGIVMSVIAFLMRTVLDPSKFPTPLPPGDPGEPDDDTPEA